MNRRQVKMSFQAFRVVANILLRSKGKTLVKVKQGISKALQNKAALSKTWDHLQVFLSLTRDYANGSYTRIPKGSIISITAGLLYFISPLDVIPDFIPGLGFLDDAYILGLVYKQVAKDLEKYKAWKDSQAKIIPI